MAEEGRRVSVSSDISDLDVGEAAHPLSSPVTIEVAREVLHDNTSGTYGEHASPVQGPRPDQATEFDANHFNQYLTASLESNIAMDFNLNGAPEGHINGNGAPVQPANPNSARAPEEPARGSAIVNEQVRWSAPEAWNTQRGRTNTAAQRTQSVDARMQLQTRIDGDRWPASITTRTLDRLSDHLPVNMNAWLERRSRQQETSAFRRQRSLSIGDVPDDAEAPLIVRPASRLRTVLSRMSLSPTHEQDPPPPPTRTGRASIENANENAENVQETQHESPPSRLRPPRVIKKLRKVARNAKRASAWTFDHTFGSLRRTFDERVRVVENRAGSSEHGRTHGGHAVSALDSLNSRRNWTRMSRDMLEAYEEEEQEQEVNTTSRHVLEGYGWRQSLRNKFRRREASVTNQLPPGPLNEVGPHGDDEAQASTINDISATANMNDTNAISPADIGTRTGISIVNSLWTPRVQRHSRRKRLFSSWGFSKLDDDHKD
ncbi:hypothetical protein H2198_009042 [Neophaeococcomyces mojaviensis]|uniref:Uncharacterized protein n=1 Tax=Neophaeococcomyces mojaviensis TaxID=3383035 RepID=A0ACC2ZVW3_9EURO|nr:hypothetical protein H2198_009042 [Knufia sp. JES_112]